GSIPRLGVSRRTVCSFADCGAHRGHLRAERRGAARGAHRSPGAGAAAWMASAGLASLFMAHKAILIRSERKGALMASRWERRDAKDDGLTQDWGQEVWWMNPPFSQVKLWLRKALDSAHAGATVVCWVKHTPGVGWWKQLIAPVVPTADVRALGRVRF